MRKKLALLVVTVLAVMLALPLAYLVPARLAYHPTPNPFRPATPDRPLSLPADEGAHFDAATEWWYYTGHLVTNDGTRYGFELVFFKTYLPDAAKIGPVPGPGPRH